MPYRVEYYYDPPASYEEDKNAFRHMGANRPQSHGRKFRSLADAINDAMHDVVPHDDMFWTDNFGRLRLQCEPTEPYYGFIFIEIDG